MITPKPNTLTLQFARQWQICVPPIYRYMDQQYIDQFFERGTLRLSSFKTFRGYKDEQRGDRSEGQSILTGLGASSTVFAVTGRGHNAYVLCGSTVEEKSIMKAFGCNGYFRIRDTANFGMTVARYIPGCIQGIEGHCVYQPKRVIRSQIADWNLDEMAVEKGKPQLDMGKLPGKLAEMGGPVEYFLKLRQFEKQREYRMVWLIEGEADGYITIQCPAAVKFCDKIT